MADINVEIDLKGFGELKQLGKIVQEIRAGFKTLSQDVKKSFDQVFKQMDNSAKKGGQKAGASASAGFLSEFKKLQYGTRTILAALGLGTLGSGTFTTAGTALGGVFGPTGAIVGGIIGAITDIIVKIGKLITDRVKAAFTTAAEVEDTRLAYELQLGPKRGLRDFAFAGQAPLNTKFTPQQLQQALVPALGAGFSDNQLKNVINSSLIAAKATRGAGYGISDVAEFAQKFAAIQIREGITKRQLVGFGIVNANKFFEDLGKTLGVSAVQAEALAKDGKHADYVLRQLHLTIRAMADQLTGGGRSGLQNLETIGDIWERITNIPRRFYELLSGDTSTYSTLKNSLRRFYAKFFDISGDLTPEGAELLKALSEGLAQIVDLLANKILTPQNIQAFANGMVTLINIINDFVTSFAKISGKVGHFFSGGLGGGSLAENMLKFSNDYKEGGLAHAFWERLKHFYNPFNHDFDKPKAGTSGQIAPGGSSSNFGIPDLESTFRKGHFGKNALPWSPEALPAENLGVTRKPPYVNQIIHHSPDIDVHIHGSAEPDRVRDAVIEGHRAAIKELEGAVQQSGGKF